MCGITGFLRLPNAASLGDPSAVEALLRRMNSALRHRGPDDEGYLFQNSVGLAMRRLKIIDLEGGRQPIFNEDGSVGVVFNGEIYNYIELRKELEAAGHHFRTQSDTEVLVHLYERDGLDFARRLRGMYAFALWDRNEPRLVLGRDPFGIKPLYWGEFNGWLLFGSEIKALYPHPAFNRRVNPASLDDHMTLMFIPSPQTVYQGLRRLGPGELLAVGPDGRRETRKYWQGLPPLERRSETTSQTAWLERLEDKISECVRLSLRSDVPLGVFLSGGLDSTLVAYYAKRHKPDLKTYTVSFAQASFDEGKDAREIAEALGTDHTDIPMDFPARPEEFAESVLRQFDEPFGDISALPTYLLCREARRYCTVCLSGDGGDELFAGYPTFIATQMARPYLNFPAWLRAGAAKAASWIPASLERVSWDYKLKRFTGQAAIIDDYRALHFSWRGAFGWSERPGFYNPDFWAQIAGRIPYDSVVNTFEDVRGANILDQLLYVDRRTYLADEFLVKTDRMSMAHSLEVRPPLLDHELSELAAVMPKSMKIKGWTTKWALRQLLKDRVPGRILRLPKRGFTPPLSLWLQQPKFGDFVLDACSSESAAEIIRRGVAERLLREHRAGKVDHTRRLWVLLGLGLFLKRDGNRV